jgi:hypothetical protein
MVEHDEVLLFGVDVLGDLLKNVDGPEGVEVAHGNLVEETEDLGAPPILCGLFGAADGEDEFGDFLNCPRDNPGKKKKEELVNGEDGTKNNVHLFKFDFLFLGFFEKLFFCLG